MSNKPNYYFDIKVIEKYYQNQLFKLKWLLEIK